jgi:hypothetical protein
MMGGMSAGVSGGGSLNGKSPKDCVTVASEKADFIADRIAAGVPAPEGEMRKLARFLREIAAEMGPGLKKTRTGQQPPVGLTAAEREALPRG